MSDFTEDTLIEQPTIALFAEQVWETTSYLHDDFPGAGNLK